MTKTLITQLAHTCLFAPDLAAVEEFYCGALGLKKVFDFKRGEDWIGFYLDLGGRTFIEIFRKGEARYAESDAINHLCLETNDLEGVVAQLRAKGIVVTDKKLGADGTWQAWTADPNGVKLEIFQYTENSMQFAPRDGVCQVNW